MNVGDYIKKLRTEKGLTQEELGEMLGVKRAAVNKWESGMVQNLKRTTIQKLAVIFNVNPATFIDGSESFESEKENKPPLKLPNADEQELLTIYRNVNQDGQDYIMQTARMVGDSERYQKPDIRLKHARSADDHGAEYVEVTPEERKRLDEAPDETQNPDNDI